jgi:hypothetical protein
MLSLLSVSLVALFTQYAYAVAFVKTYGGIWYDVATSVQQTSDGGYIVAGITNFFGAGNYDILLLKTDANGNIIWAKTYGGTNYDYASSVRQTSDGGYIVAGWTESFGAGNRDVLLIKTDANGNIIWAKTYGGTGSDIANSVQQTSDGGYIVGGNTYSFGTGWYNIFLIKTDANGNIIWAKTYGSPHWDWASSVQQTSDGGYIVAGETDFYGIYDKCIFLIKTDASGNIIWAKIYTPGIPIGIDSTFLVQQTSDGGYIVAGYSPGGAGAYDILLMKTDANGNIIWAKTYGGTSLDWASSVQQTSDGGYIVAGITNSFGAGNYDILLLKTDANGNIQWAKTYGGTYDDWASSVQQTSDGRYIVVGGTGSFGAGAYDFFLIKTDENGSSCSIDQSVSPTVNTVSKTIITVFPYVSFPIPTVLFVSPTVTSPTLTVLSPCPSSISESCQVVSGLITPYKGGIKVSKSGEFEVKVYNVSGGVVKSARGKNEVKIELSRGVYFVEVVWGGKVLREKVVIR